MKMTFVALKFGVPDSHGDVFLPGSVKSCSVPVTKDFDAAKVLGSAEVSESDGHLIADAELISDDLSGLTPAIGFQILKSEKNEHGGLTMHEIKLHYIGLSLSPNIDPTIPPIE